MRTNTVVLRWKQEPCTSRECRLGAAHRSRGPDEPCPPRWAQGVAGHSAVAMATPIHRATKTEGVDARQSAASTGRSHRSGGWRAKRPPRRRPLPLPNRCGRALPDPGPLESASSSIRHTKSHQTRSLVRPFQLRPPKEPRSGLRAGGPAPSGARRPRARTRPDSRNSIKRGWRTHTHTHRFQKRISLGAKACGSSVAAHTESRLRHMCWPSLSWTWPHPRSRGARSPSMRLATGASAWTDTPSGHRRAWASSRSGACTRSVVRVSRGPFRVQAVRGGWKGGRSGALPRSGRGSLRTSFRNGPSRASQQGEKLAPFSPNFASNPRSGIWSPGMPSRIGTPWSDFDGHWYLRRLQIQARPAQLGRLGRRWRRPWCCNQWWRLRP